MMYISLMRPILMILLILSSMSIFGQAETEAIRENSRLRGVVHQEEWAVEIKAHTSGLAVGFYKGELKNYYKTLYRKIELGYIRHPQEFRQNIQSASSGLNIFVPGTTYVFGKQNSLLYIKAGIGQKHYLSEKTKRRGLAIGFNYEVGPTLGILKPYYLDVSVQRDGQPTSTVEEIKYDGTNEDLFLDRSGILGHSGFFQGINEPKFVIGAHAKAGIHLAPGAYGAFVRTIEAGISIDAFTKRVPILIIENNKFVFVNLYLSIHLGKRS